MTTAETKRNPIYADAESEPARGTAEHALWLVNWHVVWERADEVDRLGLLYTDDIEWEMHAPGIEFTYSGKESVLNHYSRLLGVLVDFRETLQVAYATPEHVFTDQEISYTVGPGAEGVMDPSLLPPGQFVHGRLMHNFSVRDGLLSREVAYFVPGPPRTG